MSWLRLGLGIVWKTVAEVHRGHGRYGRDVATHGC